jgi:hypothetical protein
MSITSFDDSGNPHPCNAPAAGSTTDAVLKRLQELDTLCSRRRAEAGSMLLLLVVLLAADSVRGIVEWARGSGAVVAGSLSTRELRVQTPESDLECLIGFVGESPTISFRKGNTELLALGLDARSDPFVRWSDALGRERMHAGVVTVKKDLTAVHGPADLCDSRLRITNANGKTALELGVTSTDLPFIRLCDQQGNPTATIEVASDGSPVIQLVNAARTRTVKLQAAPGESAIMVKDENGRIRTFP